tara:strand:+ start:1103 stop:1684 length:582 start_codon:yes stop_codon:yes gene_type:complete
MYSNNNYKGIDPIIISIVRSKAQELTRHKYFLPSDLEDIEQELMLEMLMKLSTYDSTKSSLWCYAKKIIENKCSSLIRTASRKKRGGDKIFCSLHQPINANGEEDYLIIDTITANSTFYEYAEPGTDDQLISEIDIRQAIRKLPPTLGEFCELLQTMNITEIARSKGIPRQAIYDIIARLKTSLQSIGFVVYA